MEIFDAYEQAKKDVDAVTETSNLLRTFQDEESMTSITYRAVDGGSIFEPLNLQDMCTFERTFWDRDAYSTVCVLSTDSNSTCVAQSMSVVNLFYGSFSNCTLLSQSHVDSVVDMMFDNAFNETVNDETRLAYSFFLSQDADVSTKTASMTKSMLVLGSPLTQDEDDDEELTGYALDGPYQIFLEAVGKDWVNMFGFKDKFLASKYRNNFVMNDRVRVKWLNDAILSNEFEYMVRSVRPSIKSLYPVATITLKTHAYHSFVAQENYSNTNAQTCIQMLRKTLTPTLEHRYESRSNDGEYAIWIFERV